MHVGDTLKTVGDTILCNLSPVGQYHDTNKRFFCHGTHDIPHGTEYAPRYSR